MSTVLLQVREKPFSFTSCRDLRRKFDLLPQPPAWRQTTIHVAGGTTKQPLILHYRDGLECFRFLFTNPTYSDYIDYCPQRVWESAEKKTRLFSEMMTGNMVWEVQVRLAVHSSCAQSGY